MDEKKMVQMQNWRVWFQELVPRRSQRHHRDGFELLEEKMSIPLNKSKEVRGRHHVLDVLG